MALSYNSPSIFSFRRPNLVGIATLFYFDMTSLIKWGHITLWQPLFDAALFALIIKIAFFDTAEGSSGLLEFIIPGIIFSGAARWCFAFAAYGTMDQKMSASLDGIIAAPLSRTEIIIANACFAIFYTLLCMLLNWLALLPFGAKLPAWPLDLAALILPIALGFYWLGLVFALICNRWDSIGFMDTIIIWPLMMLSGVWFGLDAITPQWQSLFLANPIWYMMDGFRQAMIGDIRPDVSAHIAVWSVAFISLFIYYWLLKNPVFRRLRS